MAVNVKDRFAAILSGRGPKLPPLPGVANAQKLVQGEADRMTAERTKQAVNQSVGQFDARPVTTDGEAQQLARLNAQYPGVVLQSPNVPSSMPKTQAPLRLGDAMANLNKPGGGVVPPKTVMLNDAPQMKGVFTPGNTEKALAKAEAANKAGTGNAVRGRSAVGAYGASNASGGATTVANIAAKLFPTMKR